MDKNNSRTLIEKEKYRDAFEKFIKRYIWKDLLDSVGIWWRFQNEGISIIAVTIALSIFGT